MNKDENKTFQTAETQFPEKVCKKLPLFLGRGLVILGAHKK